MLRGIVGNIYLGRVVRVLPGMQSAFIDAGLERAAFLHVADIWRHEPQRDSPARPDGVPDERARRRSLAAQGVNGNHEPIERLLHEGQSLLVQIVKEPLGTKGARLSTQMSIAGRLLVYLPQEPHAGHIGVSQRIGDEAGREQLRARVPAAAAARARRGGYIVRTLAEDASDEDLAADIAYLRKLWDDILDDEPHRARADAAVPGPRTRAAHAARLRRRRDRTHPGRLARELREARRIRARVHAEGRRRASRTTSATGRCSSATASTPRSNARSRAASTSSRAAT